ncbi:hypothetical protein CGCS363_v011615 [Colletotrichum siamense]|uniref:uncharacterized protein n=1 Tax=Colletotrichum siamense TaxID=690259 RepID=UPI0018723F90|nr:uncharacterized protein CGCS363_v011615 [Colletotrichum siamense]KAF5492413.1 hypothetical protein CGCS363_v011615 [Colletotrichum siamense]
MPLRRKISVMAMFSVGIFLTIVSIIRIKSLLDFAKTPNITAELLGGVIWSHIELCVGIAVACMPAARHLAWRLFPKLLELSRRTLSKSSKTKPSVHVEELQPVAKGRRSLKSDTTTTLQSNTTTMVDPNTPNSAHFP